MVTRYVECSTCGRWWHDTDNTGVCPGGHENRWSDDDYGYGDNYASGVTI